MMDNNQNNNERIELDQRFLDMLADRLTAQQHGQGKLAPTKAATALATMLTSFYKELRRRGVPRPLSFSLTQMLLNLILRN